MSALGAALCSTGIPNDSIVTYESSLRAGKYLLIAHGDPGAVTKAKRIIEQTDSLCVQHHVPVAAQKPEEAPGGPQSTTPPEEPQRFWLREVAPNNRSPQ